MQKISVQLGLVGSCSLNDDYYGDVASHGDRSVGGLQLLLFLQFFLLYNPKIFFFGLHLATLTAIVLSLLLPVCPSTTGSVLLLISDSFFFPSPFALSCFQLLNQPTATTAADYSPDLVTVTACIVFLFYFFSTSAQLLQLCILLFFIQCLFAAFKLDLFFCLLFKQI